MHLHVKCISIYILYYIQKYAHVPISIHAYIQHTQRMCIYIYNHSSTRVCNIYICIYI